MDPLIIFTAKYLIIIPAVLVLWIVSTLPSRERVRFVALLVLALPIAYIIAKIASHFYINPRPFVVGNFTPLVEHGPDNGFPSDHTLLAASLAAAVTAIRPRIGAMLWIAVLLIGIARIFAGVHHAVDIIGSIVIAAVAVYATDALLNMRLPRALRE